MAFPTYRRLKRRYPHAAFYLVCPDSLATLIPTGVFERTLCFPAARRSRFQVLKALARELRLLSADLAFSFPSSYSAHLPLFGAGIPERIGFYQGGSQALLTAGVAWKGVRAGGHKSRMLEALADLVDAPTDDSGLIPTHARQPLIVVAPGASITLREWPHYRALVLLLSKLYPEMELTLVGTRAERVPWDAFLAREKPLRVQNKMGDTDLPALQKICERAALVIGNDSGVAHLAATLAGTPVVALFGPGDPTYVRPQGEGVEIVRDPALACSPCESAHCAAPFGYQRCLRNLSLDTVLDAVGRLLAKRSATPV